jgi:hypothetical protein
MRASAKVPQQLFAILLITWKAKNPRKSSTADGENR